MLPHLLHPVPITIESIDQTRQEDNGGDGSWFDDDFREPVQQVEYSTAAIVMGQVKWGDSLRLGVSRSGPEAEAEGYVLFRYVDLEAKGITLHKNDRLTKIGKLATDVYIISLRPEGHYTDQGGATLVKAFFKDRQPSRQGA